jgi:hypothetical protein
MMRHPWPNESDAYIRNNRAFTPTLGNAISTAFLESTMRHVISPHFVKQQMHWTRGVSHPADTDQGPE